MLRYILYVSIKEEFTHPLSSISILFNDFLYLPNAFWQSLEPWGTACCFQSKVTYAAMNVSNFTDYFVNTGLCLWSWLLWLMLVEELVSLLLSHLWWISFCVIVEHQCKIVSLKRFFFFSLILTGWHQNLTFTADALDSWEKKYSAGKYHCSYTENVWHYLLYHLAYYRNKK